MNNMTDWIETEGSPFIIIELKYADEWNGREDYDSVCRITDYMGKIDRDNHAILVMGDEPMAVRIIQQEGQILIIRWMYAPNLNAVDRLLESDIIEGLEPIEEIQVEWNSNQLVLFDSLYRFCEAPIKMYMTLQATYCVIRTYLYKRDDIALIIHSIQQ